MAWIQAPMAVFSVCAGLCALVFWSTRQSWAQPVYRVVPSVILIYYLPMIFSNLGLLPSASPVYDWMRDYLLPFSLLVLMATTDIPAVLRVGPKAIGMMLFGTLGVVIGGPIAFLLFSPWLPPDSWKALAALSGSWIGGGGNFAAVKESVGAPDTLIGPIIIVDTAVGYTWTGILLFLAAHEKYFDSWNRASTRIIEDLNERMRRYQADYSEMTTMFHLTATLAVGFGGTLICREVGLWLDRDVSTLIFPSVPGLAGIFSPFTWMIILITTLGILLSFSPVRRLEKAGASRVGYTALYLFLASLGAKADLAGLLAAPIFLLVGAVWILFHIAVLLIGARLLRAPLFLVAVGSQANIGGAATAPIVAAAYYEALAPVGVLMGILGYLVGNYAGLFCAFLLSLLA